MALEFGLQVFSVRRSMEEDFWGTLEKVAKIGYKYIEFANHDADKDCGIGHNIDATELRNRMSDLGLGVIASHVGPITDDNFDKIIEYHKALGNKSIIEAIAFWSNKSEVLTFADSLNKKGKKLHENGLDFCYHNHFMEFQEFEGKKVIDILREETDKDYVEFEVDLYWAYRAGISKPDKYIKELGDRCHLVHLKDIPATVKEPNIYNIIGKDAYIDLDKFVEFTGVENFTEIGVGAIGAERIVKSLDENPNIDCLIVEQDKSERGELESIEISFKNMQAFLNK